MHRVIYVILSLAMCAALLGCPAAPDQTGKVIDETFFKDLPPEGSQHSPGWIISVVKKGRLVACPDTVAERAELRHLYPVPV